MAKDFIWQKKHKKTNRNQFTVSSRKECLKLLFIVKWLLCAQKKKMKWKRSGWNYLNESFKGDYKQQPSNHIIISKTERNVTAFFYNNNKWSHQVLNKWIFDFSRWVRIINNYDHSYHLFCIRIIPEWFNWFSCESEKSEVLFIRGLLMSCSFFL